MPLVVFVTLLGNEKALGYLIGEKLLNHIRSADSRPEWAEKLPLFLAEIRRIFTADELQTYFAAATRASVLRDMWPVTRSTKRCATPACSTTT